MLLPKQIVATRQFEVTTAAIKVLQRTLKSGVIFRWLR